MKSIRRLREAHIQLVLESQAMAPTRKAYLNPSAQGIDENEIERLDSAVMSPLQDPTTGAFFFTIGYSSLGGPDGLS